ncbi:YegS/Rv2252/BmrU family lipid kinase [Adhaeribacter sp. BT258]|uniref:YegS/Rv2252/BmrU family lipid kinase n=1 Tax=Adhaeribacter terrigena TaxID=2793070 RepID=A0ABS1C020_9BACT|nr:YegS/Rv2252/BmrU family lipid kinase [Adhaeribacter terrigena]MBK0402516.1 YegS/Rv2252/BmrU family lipid kinase [Adhaeribacter terrigena]
MQESDKILFILNPKSGRKSAVSVPALIPQYLAENRYKIVLTEFAGHATELARQGAKTGFRVIAAVGGDGTVNEVARGLLGTKAALAIIPKGSGNGLARHLNINMQVSQALKDLSTSKFSRIDSCTINGHPFFCTAGLGFDGYISGVFANNARRGLRSYVELVLKEFLKFKPGKASIKLNQENIDTPCFVLTFANASQYGNNAYIAPMADIRDGLLDVCLIRDLSFRKAVAVSYGLLTKTIATTGHADFFTSPEISVKTEKPMPYHADGEYVGEASEFHVQIRPLSLEVLTPQ